MARLSRGLLIASRGPSPVISCGPPWAVCIASRPVFAGLSGAVPWPLRASPGPLSSPPGPSMISLTARTKDDKRGLSGPPAASRLPWLIMARISRRRPAPPLVARLPVARRGDGDGLKASGRRESHARMARLPVDGLPPSLMARSPWPVTASAPPLFMLFLRPLPRGERPGKKHAHDITPPPRKGAGAKKEAGKEARRAAHNLRTWPTLCRASFRPGFILPVRLDDCRPFALRDAEQLRDIRPGGPCAEIALPAALLALLPIALHRPGL